MGKAIIVVSSELPEVMGICDRIIVMHSGKIQGSVMKEEATEKNIMSLAVGGV
jgi:ABC-type sugar transport system, ATPase component